VLREDRVLSKFEGGGVRVGIPDPVREESVAAAVYVDGPNESRVVGAAGWR